MPRTHLTILAIATIALSLAACASGPQRGPAGGFKIDVASQAETILADARRKKAEKNCAAAIPSYRVVSSFGKGYDVAQSELGNCLLEVASADNTDTALLQEEALFWLRRSAYAGNARAQLALSNALSGAAPGAAGITPNLVESYGWALIYEDNAAHSLYGLPDLHPQTAAFFRTQLNDTATTAAQSFAASYKQVEMDVFVPPFAGDRERGQANGGRRGQGGERPRTR